MAEIILALGSNLGDRMAYLRQAVRNLRECVVVSRVSSVVESPAREVERGPPQGPYLNVVLRGRTRLEPGRLLEACQELETRAGRTRTFEKAPRTLDVDILFYDDRVIRRPGLQVPHPRWKERDFVLVPLREVAAEWTDPESCRTVEEIARNGGVDGAESEGLRQVAGPDALAERE